MNADFFLTDEGQLITGSVSYLRSARILRESGAWAMSATMLQKPTLHLIAHGIELLLKYPIVRSGKALDQVRREFGHNLQALWNSPENIKLKNDILNQSRKAWDAAEVSGKWKEDFSIEPSQAIEEDLISLSKLHSADTHYALRYPSKRGLRAPMPPFLLDVFGDVAERIMLNADIDVSDMED